MKHVFPQRLSPAAPMGSLLKRTGKDRTATRDQAPAGVEHGALVRQLPCLKCGVEPCGEAAHVKRGLGHWRPPHRVVPLCNGCHLTDPDAQHKIGEEAFWGGLGIDPVKVAKRLWEASGDAVRMRMIVMTAIAERTT